MSKRRIEEAEWTKGIITPRVATSCIVESIDRENLLMIERKFPPHGFAFPGGMMDKGETIEECGVREVKEETGIGCRLYGVLGVLSDPKYDSRWYVVVVQTVGQALYNCLPEAADDALRAFWMSWEGTTEVIEKMTDGARDMFNVYKNWRREPCPLGVLK